jgi:hypothetical protein
MKAWLCVVLVLVLGAPSAAAASTTQLAAAVGELEDKAELMEWSADRFDAWTSCLRGVPVTEYGDTDRQYGYVYDERDGSGPGFMPALAVDRRSRDGREDYQFLAMARGCHSAPPEPGGTAEPAAVSTLRELERRVTRLRRMTRRLLAASERFDAWESCVSWVPVTEYGDPDGGFGYAFDSSPLRFRPALAIDRSDWDDPDYMFLAFVGGNRPDRECHNEPGEAVD